jgi:hypothetical protein
MIRAGLENMLFKPSEQKGTLAGNARMSIRLIFFVLRTIQQKHKWCADYSICKTEMQLYSQAAYKVAIH